MPKGPQGKKMKRESYRDLLSPFTVVAERAGKELGRCQIDALDEADAMAGGLYLLSDKLDLALFDFTIDFRAERTNAARA